MSRIGHKPTNFKHGYSDTSEFRAWIEMHRRCTAMNRKSASRWAARGIKVCERWSGEDGFTNFILDMDWKPTEKHTLDRINVNGNYEPSNCRWATQKEQQNNRSDNYLITINGVTKNARQWADEYDIPNTTFWNRIKKGWTGEKLISKKDYRTHRLITINGVSKTITEWCKEYNIPDTTFHNRLNRGYTGIDLLRKRFDKY